MKIRNFMASSAMAIMMLATGVAQANTITVGDGATGTEPYDLVSNSATLDSYIEVGLSTPTAFNSITSLSASFNDVTGGADGGSPRIWLGATNGDFFQAYLGTPPNFNDGSPAAFTSAFSGVNLDNGTNNSAFENLGTYQTLASLQATYGSDLINNVAFVVDGGWAANGAQDLTLSGLDVNGANALASSRVPEPSSLPILLAGLGLIAGAYYFGRKKAMAA